MLLRQKHSCFHHFNATTIGRRVFVLSQQSIGASWECLTAIVWRWARLRIVCCLHCTWMRASHIHNGAKWANHALWSSMICSDNNTTNNGMGDTMAHWTNKAHITTALISAKDDHDEADSQFQSSILLGNDDDETIRDHKFLPRLNFFLALQPNWKRNGNYKSPMATHAYIDKSGGSISSDIAKTAMQPRW